MQLSGVGRLMGSSGVSGYKAFSTNFDGSTDFMRGTLANLADGKKGLVSFWYTLDGNDDNQIRIITSSTGFINVRRRETTNLWQVSMFANDFTTLVELDGDTAVIAGAGQHHFAASWDVGNAKSHLLVDGVADFTETTLVDGTIDYTDNDYTFGAAGDDSGKWDGCLSELYWNPAEYLDLSVPSNMAKLRTAAGKPANLGSDGSLVTGTAPIGYWNNPFGSFEINKGTGGNLSMTGTPVACVDSPSDL